MTFEIVQDIIVQKLGVECCDVKPESLLDDDLLEEFNIVLTKEAVGSWSTVQDIVDSVDRERG